MHWAELDYLDLGAWIAPWAQDWVGSEWILYHCVVAYAFGQSMHYFVWLKAIPDQHHTSEAPTSFRQSLRLLQVDFGRKSVLVGAGLILLSLAAWAFVLFPQARALYFALAAYHGYLELAGLGVARLKLQVT